MTIDERIEALTMNLELASRDIQDLKIAAPQDGEHIRQLAAIARDTLHSIKDLENTARIHE